MSVPWSSSSVALPGTPTSGLGQAVDATPVAEMSQWSFHTCLSAGYAPIWV